MRRTLLGVCVAWAVTAACAGGETDGAVGGGGAGGHAQSGGGGAGFGGNVGGGPECSCSSGIHDSRILVLGDDASIWSFDPATDAFDHVRDIPCGVEHPFSMAVDEKGVAWILDADSKDIVTVELAGSGGCGDPGYDPGPLQAGFGLFGMAFSSRGPSSQCSDLYAHSYSGQGPFNEGPDVGVLGRLDRDSMHFEILAGIDYNGGELAGTGDGRLFAFAGVDPMKLVEYDRTTGAELMTVPLDGLDETHASAFAVFGGSVYFFTEAPPVGCDGCLDANCGAAYSSCLQDETCAMDLACAIQSGDIQDDCGGSLSQELQSCLAGTCGSECLPAASDRQSQVTKLDLSDVSRGITLEVPLAPIRVVGAGTSICAPVVPE